jgi:hypothetical protein
MMDPTFERLAPCQLPLNIAVRLAFVRPSADDQELNINLDLTLQQQKCYL